MKKLLVLLALFTFAALGAQDVFEQYWGGDASYNFHAFVGPDGNPAVDGWAIRFVLDAAGDGIDGIDPATLLPMDDDAYPLTQNFYMDALNGSLMTGVPGTWYASAMLMVEDPTGSPAEPVINWGDYLYIVLFNADDPMNATHYCTTANSWAANNSGGPHDVPLENWTDDAWVALSSGPSFADATNPLPADGATDVALNIGMLCFDYDATGFDAPDHFDVYFGSDNPPMTIHETIPYDAGTTTYDVVVPDPLMYADDYFWSVVPAEATTPLTRKGNAAKRAQQSSFRVPALWSFTTAGEPQTQTVPVGGSQFFTFADGSHVEISGAAVGGDLSIVEFDDESLGGFGLLDDANSLGLTYDIDPGDAWTDFPVTVTITWDAPAPAPSYVLGWYDDVNGQWVKFGTVTSPQYPDGVIIDQNLTVSPYYITFSANHFTGYTLADPMTLPVELTKFDGQYSADLGGVTLSWSVASETDMMGYNVRRCDTDDAANAQILEFVAAQNSPSGFEYSILDDNEIEEGATYYYWIESIEQTGQTNLYGSIEVEIITEIPPVNEVTQLNAAYPNPFNPTTTLSFSIKDGETGELTIYNVLGQVVKTFPTFEAGSHQLQWQGRDNNNNTVSSGIYFYKLETNSYNKINKMLLLK